MDFSRMCSSALISDWRMLGVSAMMEPVQCLVARKVSQLLSKVLTRSVCLLIVMGIPLTWQLEIVSETKSLVETFDTIKKVCNLVKKSSKKDTHLKKLRDLTENGKKRSCFLPDQMDHQGESCLSMIENYDELMELWLWSLDNAKDTEMKAKIRGVQSYTGEFKFLFGCHLGKLQW